MLGCQNLRAYKTWLPELLSKYSNPFQPGTLDYLPIFDQCSTYVGTMVFTSKMFEKHLRKSDILK